MVRIEAGRSGRTLVRFNAFERFVHWMTAVCFIVLALSGLNITFGKDLLLPLIGPEAFTGWSQWAKYAHNYLSFPFTLGVVLIFLMWIACNFPSRGRRRMAQEGRRHRRPRASAGRALQPGSEDDLLDRRARRRRGGGHRLSADVPVLRHRHRGHADRAGHSRHRRACCSSPGMLAHIYIGTIGMEGAFEAMGTAPSTRTGPSSTTASGSRKRRPRARSPRRRRPGGCSRRNSALCFERDLKKRPACRRALLL